MAGKGEESESTNGENDSFILLSYLDEVESRVESLRRHAAALNQERASLLTVLHQIKEESLKSSVTEGECQEIISTIDRLQQRCKTVEIAILTPRSTDQEEAYLNVDKLVKGLEQKCILGDPNDFDYHEKANSYLNACLSDVAGGPIDYKFQGLVLGCVLEDQKQVRHRLESLVKGKCHVSYMDDLENSLQKQMLTSDEEKGHGKNSGHFDCDNSSSTSHQPSAVESDHTTETSASASLHAVA